MAGIVIKIDNTSPISPVVPSEIMTETLCLCDFVCKYTEKAFASPSDDDLYKKDFSDFLFRKISPSDTIELELLRYGSKVDDLNDDDLGVYYPSFSAQPLYVGYVIDWTKVFNLYSGGTYVIRAKMNILGVEQVIDSRQFHLSIFDEGEALRTVKIRSIQNGNIESSEFDYTNLIEGGWVSYRRIRGLFGNVRPTLERDQYLDAARNITQIQDQITNEYTLTLERLSEKEIFNFFNQNLLANEIFITDYNKIEISKDYIDFPVVPENPDDFNYSPNGRGDISITFRDRRQNVLKRNF